MAYQKLRGRIVEKYGTLGSFASALGVKQCYLSAKLTQKVSMSTKDISKWSELLGIEAENIGYYFFEK